MLGGVALCQQIAATVAPPVFPAMWGAALQRLAVDVRGLQGLMFYICAGVGLLGVGPALCCLGKLQPCDASEKNTGQVLASAKDPLLLPPSPDLNLLAEETVEEGGVDTRKSFTPHTLF